MTIDPAVVGRNLGEMERVVGWRDTTNYAAAVGECDPRYLDDSFPEGLAAPPIYPVVMTWPLLSGLGERLGSAMPREALARLVHGGEHLELHRPVRPGDRVAMSGRVVSLRPGRAGARMVLRVDAQAGGQALFTEHTTVLFRGVDCPGEGADVQELPGVPATAGEQIVRWESEVWVGREVPFVYDGCTNIVFPIHTSVSFARGAGLPDLLVQGTWTLARAVREVVNREAHGDPSRLREVGCRFAGMVVPGTRILVRAMAAAGDGPVSFMVIDEGGATAVEGWARFG